jgi:hypothetical protein
LLGILTLLLAPATATYHFVLLWLPVGLLARYLFQSGSPRGAVVMLLCYVLIGFCPYGHTVGFAGRGILNVLAYPRLCLLLLMFLVGVYCLWHGTALRTEGERPEPGADAAVTGPSA